MQLLQLGRLQLPRLRYGVRLLLEAAAELGRVRLALAATREQLLEPARGELAVGERLRRLALNHDQPRLHVGRLLARHCLRPLRRGLEGLEARALLGVGGVVRRRRLLRRRLRQQRLQ